MSSQQQYGSKICPHNLCACTPISAHTLIQLIMLCGQSAKQPNLFSVSLSHALRHSALCFFKVPTLCVFLYLSAQFVSASVSLSLYQLLSTPPSPSLPVTFSCSPSLFIFTSLMSSCSSVTRPICPSGATQPCPNMSPDWQLQQQPAGQYYQNYSNSSSDAVKQQTYMCIQ